ncbi:hypothetical protein [Gloeocapsopsis sp. IPPAS B-1203]|nr:hypothetical protein [Gloeocapsopsis sp. IPPAS B-1203]
MPKMAELLPLLLNQVVATLRSLQVIFACGVTAILEQTWLAV